MKKFLCMLFILICLPLSVFTGCFKPDPAETIEFDYQTYTKHEQGSYGSETALHVEFIITNNKKSTANLYITDFIAIYFHNDDDNRDEQFENELNYFIINDNDEVDRFSIDSQESKNVSLVFIFPTNVWNYDIEIHYIKTNEVVASFSTTLHI